MSGKLCMGINNTVRRQFDATSIYLNNKAKSPSPIVYDAPCDGLLSGFIVSVMDSFSVESTPNPIEMQGVTPVGTSILAGCYHSS